MRGKEKFFLDSNILLYTFDATAPGKRSRSRALVEEALASRRGIISYQVVQEFLNVSTQKFRSPFTLAEATVYLEDVLRPLCQVHSSIDLSASALTIRDRYGIAFYDALIVAAASAARCRILYTEDFQDGLEIGGVTIRNPFAGDDGGG